MNGHIAHISGWLCTIKMIWDVPTPSDYFSGHYPRLRLYVQAMFDTNLHIVYLSITGPGNMNDEWGYMILVGLPS